MTAEKTVDDTSTAGNGWWRIAVAMSRPVAASTSTRRTSRASFGIIGPRARFQGRWKTSESSSEKTTTAVSSAASDALTRQPRVSRRVARSNAVSAATENLRVVRGLVGQGDASPTDVVDAELALIRAQQAYYTALYYYQVALARLAYAVGLPVLADLPAGAGGPCHE